MITVKEVPLRVMEGIQEDVGKVRVRIDPEIMQEFEMMEGSIVEILGNKTTGAIVFPGSDDDRGQKIIRMDGLVRGNAGTSLGEIVNCKIISLKLAKKISIASTQREYKINDLDFVQKTLKDYLLEKPIASGDFIKVLSDQTASFAFSEIT